MIHLVVRRAAPTCGASDPDDPDPLPPCPTPIAVPPPPTPRVPSCSIYAFTRGVPFAGSPANHTYLDISEVSGSGATIPNDVLEGGPTNSHNPITHPGASWGNLVGDIEPVAGGQFLGGTNPATNTELGWETGPGTCSNVDALLNAINNYDTGPGVAYSPLPNGTTTFNSNSFTYTLLNDIGLGGAFQSVIGWSPGWGQLVPGLQP